MTKVFPFHATVSVVVALPHVAGSSDAARASVRSSARRADEEAVTRVLGATYDATLKFRSTSAYFSPDYDCAVFEASETAGDLPAGVVGARKLALWCHPDVRVSLAENESAFRLSDDAVSWVDRNEHRRIFDPVKFSALVEGFTFADAKGDTLIAHEHCPAASPHHPRRDEVVFVRSVDVVENGVATFHQDSPERSLDDFTTRYHPAAVGFHLYAKHVEEKGGPRCDDAYGTLSVARAWSLARYANEVVDVSAT